MQQASRGGAERVGADDHAARAQNPCGLGLSLLAVHDALQHRDRHGRVKEPSANGRAVASAGTVALSDHVIWLAPPSPQHGRLRSPRVGQSSLGGACTAFGFVDALASPAPCPSRFRAGDRRLSGVVSQRLIHCVVASPHGRHVRGAGRQHPANGPNRPRRRRQREDNVAIETADAVLMGSTCARHRPGGPVQAAPEPRLAGWRQRDGPADRGRHRRAQPRARAAPRDRRLSRSRLSFIVAIKPSC
jgi:hypothetical protein